MPGSNFSRGRGLFRRITASRPAINSLYGRRIRRAAPRRRATSVSRSRTSRRSFTGRRRVVRRRRARR